MHVWYLSLIKILGLPSAAYFPFSNIGGQALIPESFPINASESSSSSSMSWLWNMFGGSSKKEKTQTIFIPKYTSQTGGLSLKDTLQYGPTIAIPQLQEIMYEFSTKVFKPAYTDYATLVHTGNTDGSVHIPTSKKFID